MFTVTIDLGEGKYEEDVGSHNDNAEYFGKSKYSITVREDQSWDEWMLSLIGARNDGYYGILTPPEGYYLYGWIMGDDKEVSFTMRELYTDAINKETTLRAVYELYVSITVNLGEGCYTEPSAYLNNPEMVGKNTYVIKAMGDVTLDYSNPSSGQCLYDDRFTECPEGMYLSGWALEGNEDIKYSVTEMKSYKPHADTAFRAVYEPIIKWKWTIDLGEGYFWEPEGKSEGFQEYNRKNHYVVEVVDGINFQYGPLIGGSYENEYIVCPEGMELYGWSTNDSDEITYSYYDLFSITAEKDLTLRAVYGPVKKVCNITYAIGDYHWEEEVIEGEQINLDFWNRSYIIDDSLKHTDFFRTQLSEENLLNVYISGWTTEKGSNIPNVDPIHCVATGDMTYYAIYKPCDLTIRLDIGEGYYAKYKRLNYDGSIGASDRIWWYYGRLPVERTDIYYAKVASGEMIGSDIGIICFGSDFRGWSFEKDGKVDIEPDGLLTYVPMEDMTIYAVYDEHVESDQPVLTDSVLYDNEIEMLEGETKKMEPKVIEPSNATRGLETIESDNPSVVEVNEDGSITAVGEGLATVKIVWPARYTDGQNEHYVKVHVKKNDIPVEKVVYPEVIEMTLGSTRTLTPSEIVPSNAKHVIENIASGDSFIVQVNENGTITAKGLGSVDLTLEWHDTANEVKRQVVRVTVVTGVMEKTKYTITLNPVIGGWGTAEEWSKGVRKMQVDINAKIGDVEEPRHKDGHYSFAGWSSLPAGEAEYTSEQLKELVPNGDKMFYAIWSQLYYNVTFDANGGHFKNSGESVEVIAEPKGGSDTQFKFPEDALYNEEESRMLLGWNTDKEARNPFDFTVWYWSLNDFTDTTLYAVWADRAEIKATSVELEKDFLDLLVGDKIALAAMVLPNDADNKSVSWSSSDTSVASVDTWGNVKALKAGAATITATTANGLTDECVVNVKEKAVEEPAACPVFGFCTYKGKKYWYEEGTKKGTYGDSKNVRDTKYGKLERGREIYDENTKSWYWLDTVYDGAAAIDKEVWMPYVYQNEDELTEVEKRENAEKADASLENYIYQNIIDKNGKWVRYGSDGHMLKGWVEIKDDLAQTYPQQAGNIYYYDTMTGSMVKGDLAIGDKIYHFNEVTGALE